MYSPEVTGIPTTFKIGGYSPQWNLEVRIRQNSNVVHKPLKEINHKRLKETYRHAETELKT